MWLQNETIEERSKGECDRERENEEQLLLCLPNGTQCLLFLVKAMCMQYVIEFARISKRNSTLDAFIESIDRWK